VEPGFFPLDEQLGLLPGGLTPFVHECLVRLAVWMPFQQAANFLSDMIGVQISKAQVVRVTEAAGAAYVSLQSEQADRIEREAPEALPGGDKMVMSADGAMVPLRKGEWAEVKTLAIGEVQPAERKQPEEGVRTQCISYFSRLVNAEQFEHLSLVEMHRRGIEKSRQVAAVMDGADWLQNFVTYHRPDAVRILDFAHAGQRIGQIGHALCGEGTPEAKLWSSQRLHQLKHDGPQAILVELRQLQQQHPQLELLSENLAYLEKREAQMQYPHFQEQGWPIGSGMVESGNKLVVEARLKGAGMHWERSHVNSMLGLRNIVCSDRWIDEWPLIVQQLRKQARERQNLNREKRRLARIPAPSDIPEAPPIPEEIVELSEKLPKEAAKKPEQNGPRKPAANHPWRNSPFGRGLYEPSKGAKN
jgi:hypothetical protein